MSLEELRPDQLPQEQVLFTKKDVLGQIMTHLKASEVDPAVNLYRRCHEDVGYELMNLVGSGPLAENLTALFSGAHDDYKAAQVFEKQGELEKAAESFEQAEAYDLAAELYGRLDNFSKAAVMLERGGSYSRAAPLFAQSERWLDAGRCYEKAAQVFEAGEAYVKAKDHNKALASLQKVDVGHERYLEAVTLLGPILEELDLPELASRKYREALGESSVDSENIGIFYSLGKSLESTGQIEEAKEIYSRVLEKDVTYADVQDRYRKAKEGAGSGQGRKPNGTQSEYSHMVVLSEDQSFLEKSLLFKGLSLDETREILQFAEKRTFDTDELIHREGEPFKGVMLIQTGKVVISMIAEGKNVRVARFGPGSHFGEMSLLGTKIALISVYGAEPGSYLFIEAGRLKAHLDAYPKLQAKIMRNIVFSLDHDLLQVKEIIKTLYTRRDKAR